MLASNYKKLLGFLCVNKWISRRFSLLKCFKKRPVKPLEICLRYWKSSNKNNSYKGGINLTATAGFGIYACSAIIKKSSPLIEENEDEFDELFIQESLKKDIELLKKSGPIPFLLIGGGPATIAALRSIRITDPTAKVVMITEEIFNPCKPLSLSNELWYLKSGDPAIRKERLFYDEYYLSVQQMLESKNGGVVLIRGKKLVKVDPALQVVYLDSGEQIAYEKCLLTTTANPKNLPVLQEVKQDIKEHVTLFHSIKDFLRLHKVCNQVKSIAVIGGGILGSELTSGLNKYGNLVGLNIIQIFPESAHLNNILPEYLCTWIAKNFQSKGIHIIPSVNVVSVQKINNKVELHLSNNKVISVDHIVVALGSEPNTDIAISSGLEIDNKLGGILVNTELKARKNLWIAGDASSFYDIKLGRSRLEHHNDAASSGRLAGENMVGKGKPFHYQANWWSVLSSDIFCECVGEIDANFKTVGIFIKPSLNGNSGPVIDKISKNVESKDNRQNDINRCIEGNLSECVNHYDNYKKGVVFYLKDNVIVGILFWNIVADIKIAKKIIKEHKTDKEAIEIAKHFYSSSLSNNSSDERKSS